MVDGKYRGTRCREAGRGSMFLVKHKGTIVWLAVGAFCLWGGSRMFYRGLTAPKEGVFPILVEYEVTGEQWVDRESYMRVKMVEGGLLTMVGLSIVIIVLRSDKSHRENA